MPIKMIVFDLAGTTIDEGNTVYQTLANTLNAAGYDFSLDQVLTYAAGHEKKTALRQLLEMRAVTSEAVVDRLYADFLDRLAAAYENLPVRSHHGAENLFAFLKRQGIYVALNTGYQRATALSLLHKLDWKEGEQYDTLVSADDVAHPRPAPDMIALAQQRLGVPDAKTVVKVGDSIIDVEEGQNAGCGWSIGITTGAHTAEQLQTAHPTLIIDHLPALELLVIENN